MSRGYGGWDDWDEGHRLPAARGAGSRRSFGTTWWAKAWVDALTQRARLDSNRLSRGRGYARNGSVRSLQVRPGTVTASVQGSSSKPYKVQVKVRTFSAAEWVQLLDVLAAQAGRLAALLDGELPVDVAEAADEAGVGLLPGPRDLTMTCSCPDGATPCKHEAALCFVVADALDADPFEVLTLRGMTRPEVMDALRARRRRSPAARSVAVRLTGPVAAEAFARTDRPQLPLAPSLPREPSAPAPWLVEPPAELDGALLLRQVASAAERAVSMLEGRIVEPGPGDDAESVAAPAPAARPTGAALRTTPAAVRAWARDQGYAIRERGRLPSEVLDAYRASHEGGPDV